MVRRVLVPLTGRPADGATLQTIVDIARGAGATVRLLYVRPVRAAANADSAPAAIDGDDERGCHQSEGSRHLDAVEARFGDIPVERVIRVGHLETTILDETAAWPADLVALSAGDPTWLSRAVRTGTAAEAFRAAGLPALLYTP